MHSIPSIRLRQSWRLPIETGSGVFLAEFSRQGLVRLEFPRANRRRHAMKVEEAPPQVQEWWSLTKSALHAALEGAAPGTLPPLDWSGATAFQCKVWTALLELRTGGTTSYGKLARSIARPRAARAVGAACGSNPVPVLVPCHRVLAADGGLGGFSGGLDWKRGLLAAERAHAQGG
jgi:O-6-methylguanine DNA methyltransferase